MLATRLATPKERQEQMSIERLLSPCFPESGTETSGHSTVDLICTAEAPECEDNSPALDTMEDASSEDEPRDPRLGADLSPEREVGDPGPQDGQLGREGYKQKRQAERERLGQEGYKQKRKAERERRALRNAEMARLNSQVDRDPPIVNHQDDSKLTIELQRLKGPNLAVRYSDRVDWSDEASVMALRKWRTYVFAHYLGTKGRAPRFHEEENQWLREAPLYQPAKVTTEAFNRKFSGKILPGETRGRPLRTAHAITSQKSRLNVAGRCSGTKGWVEIDYRGTVQWYQAMGGQDR